MVGLHPRLQSKGSKSSSLRPELTTGFLALAIYLYAIDDFDFYATAT